MYLHIGNQYYLKKNEIVAIFDMDNATYSHRTREMLNRGEKDGRVINAAEDEIPISFIMTETNGTRRIYLSMVSSQTLHRRADEHLF